MNRKLFAVSVMACLAGLGALATQSRQQLSSAADRQAPVAPTVETTVVQRTEYVRKRVRHARRHASAGGSGSRAATRSTTSGRAPSAPATPRQLSTEPVAQTPAAPKPTTSPSATGGGSGENEAEHEVEHHENGGESEREDD